MSRQRRRSRRAPQAPQTSQAPQKPFHPDAPQELRVPDEKYKAFQQQAPRYTGVELVLSSADQAAAKRWRERLERLAQEDCRSIEAQNARAAAVETAKREAAEREARRRRRSRAAKRAAKRKAAEREAARVIAEQQTAAEREAVEREAVERRAKAKAAKRKAQREQRKKGDFERVRMSQADIEWAKKVLQDGAAKGFHTIDAAFSWFEDCWRKDPERKKQKVPGRGQFVEKIWKHRARRLD